MESAEISVISQKKARKPRFWELDFLRGVCVLLMIFDHIIQIMYLSNNPKMIAFSNDYIASTLHVAGQAIVKAVFFLLCGISCTLSKSNISRGLRLGAVACAVSFFTFLAEKTFDESMFVVFGVLHMLAVAILFFGVLEIPLKSLGFAGKLIPAVFGILIIVLFHSTIKNYALPLEYRYIGMIFGFDNVVDTADYSPLFPYVGYVLIGASIGALVYKSKYCNYLALLDGVWNKPVSFVGRHALIIYIIHPIVISAAYYLIFAR